MRGLIAASEKVRLARDAETTERNRQKLDAMQTPTEDFFPATVTSGSSGLHAWTEQVIDSTRTRYTKSGGRTGTTSWMPARMPDGSTLTTFPQAVWLKGTGVVSNLGPDFEIITNSEDSGGGATGDPSGGPLFSAQSTTISARVEIGTNLPSLTTAGTYLLSIRVQILGQVDSLKGGQAQFFGVYCCFSDQGSSTTKVYGPGYDDNGDIIRQLPALPAEMFVLMSQQWFVTGLTATGLGSVASLYGIGNAQWLIEVTTPTFTPKLELKTDGTQPFGMTHTLFSTDIQPAGFWSLIKLS